MQTDVLVDFYIASVKVQLHEYRLCIADCSEDYASALFRETETVRRELGAAMCRLLQSALPSFMRNPRLFRTKYTEEVDLRNLEKCLIAAANKVVSFNEVLSPRDYDLRPAQPSATKFLDILMQVQFVVSNLIELALASCDREALTAPNVRNIRDLSASADCIRTSEKWKVGRVDAIDGLVIKPAALRVRHQSLPSHDQTTKSGLDLRKSKVSTSPKASTSQPNRHVDPGPISAATNVVIVQVRIGPNTYHERIRLPPASRLVISEELHQRLLELDEAAARFEYEFVRTLSRRMRTVQEAEDLQMMTVLFSETLMWGLAVRLFSFRQLADRDPTVLLSLPRLAILVGTRILPDSPIGAHRLAAGRRIPFMCAQSRVELAYLVRQLYALRLDQLFRLARWLGPRGLPNLKPGGSARLVASPTVTRTLSPSSTQLCQTRQSSLCASFSPPPSHRTWKANLAGLHHIYKTVAIVADRFTSDFPTELRFILQAVIEMHDTSEQDAAWMQHSITSVTNLTCSTTSTDVEINATRGDSLSRPSSSSSESSDTDLEDELVVDTKALGSDPKEGSLAKLLDWSDVISHRETSKTRLIDLLRSSAVSAMKWAVSEESLLFPALSQPAQMQKKLSMNRAPTGQMELGVDVAAMIQGNETVVSCNMDETTTTNELSELRSYLIAPGDRSHPNAEQSTLDTPRFHKSALGTSVEGMRSPIDQVVHFLPAWQPDRLHNRGRSHSRYSDSEADDRVSDSDDDRSTIDDDYEGIVYQVGRQCASCLRAFNLFRRRHHCRRCGHIFCATCCNHWQTVEGLATDKAVRICTECHEFLNVKLIP